MVGGIEAAGLLLGADGQVRHAGSDLARGKSDLVGAGGLLPSSTRRFDPQTHPA
jgi:hypothetical protein